MKNYTTEKFRAQIGWLMETPSSVKVVLECGKSPLTEKLFGNMKATPTRGGLMAMNLEAQR